MVRARKLGERAMARPAQPPPLSLITTLIQRLTDIMNPKKNTRLQVTDRKFQLFLKLPPELRNTIYRMALVEDSEIFVGRKGVLPCDPPLLQTCKQIRSEASSIFYGDNSLRLSIYDLDISTVVEWLSLSPAHGLMYQKAAIIILYPHSPAHFDQSWTNLLTWVEFYCQCRCGRVRRRSLTDPDDKPRHWINMIAEVFDVVDEMIKDYHYTVDEVVSDLRSNQLLEWDICRSLSTRNRT